MKKPTSETELSRAIREALELVGCVVVRVNAGGRLGRVKLAPAGTADLLVCSRGAFVALEVKLPGRGADPQQVAWGERVLRAGGRWVVVTSVAEALREVGHG